MIIDYYKIYEAEYQSNEDINFLKKNLLPGKVLEVGCGTGRILSQIENFRLDIDLYGIDIDSKALEIAKRKSKNPDKIFFADGVHFEFHEKFESIYFMFNGFMHLNRNDCPLFFDNMYHHLNKGGLLFLSISNPCPDRISEKFPYYKYQKSISVGDYCVDKYESNKYDLKNQSIYRIFNYDYIDFNGNLKRIQSRFKVNYFYLEELERLVQNHKFKIKSIFGGYDGEDFVDSSDRIVLVLEK